MAFYGNTFYFNNISSERYGLYITTETKSTIDISNYKSNLIKTNGRNKFYATKRVVDEPLVLNISFMSETHLSRNQIDQIENWLFGDNDDFKKLRINQEDMKGYYYNCRLRKLESETYANQIYVCHALMECDSHYVWMNHQTRVFSITSVPYTAKFVNISSENLLRPTYELKCNSDNGTIKIVNSNLDTMEFTGLYNDEVITINTDYEIITSNLRTSGLLDLFTNINFMKLPKGNNIFTITGNISEFKLTYQNCKKVGN